VFQEAIGVLVPQQQARVQWLQPTPAGHVCGPDAGADLGLRGTAVFGVVKEDRGKQSRGAFAPTNLWFSLEMKYYQ
jgi:hypothetical protein